MKIKNPLICLLALGSIVLSGCEIPNISNPDQGGGEGEPTNVYKITVGQTPASELTKIAVDSTDANMLDQYEATVTAVAGTKISFNLNDTAIKPLATGNGNNLSYNDQSKDLTVIQDCENAKLYLKVYQNYYDAWLNGYVEPHVLGATINNEAITLTESTATLPSGVKSQLKATLTSVKVDDQLAFTLNGTALTAVAGEEGNNLSSSLKVLTACDSAELTFNENNDDTYSAFLTGYVEPHVLAGTINETVINFTENKDTLPQGVKLQLKATLTNVKVDDQLAFSLNGTAITVVAGEDGNNLSSNLKVLTACDSAELTLNEKNDDTYSAFLTGYVEPHVLAVAVNGASAVTLTENKDTLPQGVKLQVKGTLTNLAVNDQLAFSLNGTAITVTAGEEGNNLSSSLQVFTAFSSAVLTLNENTDDTYSAWLSGYVFTPLNAYIHLLTNGSSKWEDLSLDYDDGEFSIMSMELHAGDKFLIQYGEGTDATLWGYSNIDKGDKDKVDSGDSNAIVINDYAFYDVYIKLSRTSREIKLVKRAIKYDVFFGGQDHFDFNPNTRTIITFEWDDYFMIDRNDTLYAEYEFTIGGDAAGCFNADGQNLDPGTYYFIFDLNNHKIDIYYLYEVEFDDGDLWRQDSAKIVAYCSSTTKGNDWFEVDNYGSVLLPSCYDKVTFVRFDSSATTFKWDANDCLDADKKVLNKTAEHDYPYNPFETLSERLNKTYKYKITGWNAGEWDD